jgi:asparagine synthase (glutamine-hydrolysing)
MRRIETKEMRKSDAIKGTDLNLKTAVHRQLLADVPIGALLSGGLDSSSIVAFAREKINELQCFTIQINGSAEIGSSDDLRFAKRVANHLSLPLEVVNVDAKRMAETLPRIIAQLDEPLADPSALNVYLISECARKRGIKVLLSGAGGDDIFSGYRRHQAVGLEPLWGWLPDSLLASIGATAKLLPTHPTFLRRIRKLLIDVSLKGDDKLVNYFRWTRREDIEKLYTEEFRAELNNTKPEQPMLDFLAAQPKMLEPLDRILALEQRFFLTDHNLTYTDRMSMASGVEIRVPFLDLDLVEFASRLPLSYKQRGTCSKWVLKKAMEPYLPRDVIYRKKMGFGLPLRSWLKSELNEWLADTLSFDRLRYRGLFDPVAVQNLISNNRESRIDAAYTLLSLASIEIWCQVYVDNMKSDVGETIS